jgi:hypothetical protein
VLERPAPGEARRGTDPLPQHIAVQARGVDGIMVFAIADGGIATIVGFPSPGLFERFSPPLTASDRAKPR